MTREWIRVNVGLLDDESYQELTIEGKAAWYTAMLLGGRQTDEGRFKSDRHLFLLLQKEGIGPGAAQQLRDLGWLIDLEGDGVELKGYRRYQQFRPASDRSHEPSRTGPDTSGQSRTTTHPPHVTHPPTRAPGGMREDTQPRDETVRNMSSLGAAMLEVFSKPSASPVKAKTGA